MRRTLIAAAAAVAATPVHAGEAVNAGTAFNPEISVILDGVYYNDSADGEGSDLVGEVDGIHAAHGHDHDHGHAHDHGGPARGFSLRETEVALSGSIDPYFDAFTYLTVSEGGGVELEEAYLTTRRLPAGLTVKAGRFLSDFGYHNGKHPHQWDFVDQNLAYGNLLGGHGIMDTGVQLAWLTPLPTYLRVGVEALQGGGAEKIGQYQDEDAIHEHAHEIGGNNGETLEGAWEETFGPRLYTAFAEWSPDLGFDHALQLGTSLAWAPDHQELHGEPDDDNVHYLDGDAWTAGLEAIYKYDHADDYGAGDLTLQGEYLYQVKDLDIAYHQTEPVVGDQREFTQDGAYLQGVYGIAPRWEAGLRYDVTGLTNEKAVPGSTSEWDASRRMTAAVTFRPSEFSQIRLQAARADLAHDDDSEKFNQLYLQYEASLGSHGAHSF
ncbi:hypothetical protein [Thiohalospira sp.]|uniref:hypothetical protein n=1 Tax=Thiohalospira sp. TaxID=3080549 RepID=UPI0039812819